MSRSRITWRGGIMAGALSLLLIVSACSSSGTNTDGANTDGAANAGSDTSGDAPAGGDAADNNGDGAIGTPDGTGKTLSVWSMLGDFDDATLDAINAKFTAETGAQVDLAVQPWDNISTKISSALASNPPDVMDIATVAPFAANGALEDLTPYADELQQGMTWLPGLVAAGTVDDKLYGVPSFAATRVAIYNKKIWAAAGVTEPPTTYDELTDALDKIKAANPSDDFSAFYLPGKHWLMAIPWVWDAGGDLYGEVDGVWQGRASEPNSIQGLKDFKEFQNAYSTKASRGLDSDSPDFRQIFSDGMTATIIGNANHMKGAIENAKDFTAEDVGTFRIPGKSGDFAASTLAGSQWTIPVKSEQKELALKWIQIAVSEDIENEYVFGSNGWIPNSSETVQFAIDSGLPEELIAFYNAADTMKAPGTVPGMEVLQDDGSMADLFGAVAQGQDIEQAAKTWDDHVNKVLAPANK